MLSNQNILLQMLNVCMYACMYVCMMNKFDRFEVYRQKKFRLTNFSLNFVFGPTILLDPKLLDGTFFLGYCPQMPISCFAPIP